MFIEIDEMIATGQSLIITIHKTANNMTVSVLPKDSSVKDGAVSKIQPIVLTGTAEDLDNEFISSISAPLTKGSGIISNISQFEKGLEDAKGNSKEGKEVAEKISKLITAAEKYEKDEKIPAAIAEYRKVLEIEPEHAKATKKITELEAESKQGNLF